MRGAAVCLVPCVVRKASMLPQANEFARHAKTNERAIIS